MHEAVARFVPDGASVCMGTALEALIPFAAGHEIMRQRRRGLTLVGPISDMLFDQLVAAGCVRRIQAAWVGNVSAGLGHSYRRAVERGIPHRIEVEDHSNLTIAAALQAGAMGAPYVPTRSLLGTGLLQSNPTFKEGRDPFSGDPTVLVPALTPDVAILHVQRADAEGLAHCWGTSGSRARRRSPRSASSWWPRRSSRASGCSPIPASSSFPPSRWRLSSTSRSEPTRRRCRAATGALTISITG